MLHEPIEGVERIAVLRANSLGDFVFTLPALSALRETYPRADIWLLAKAWHSAFLEGRETPVDRVVVLPPVPGVSAEPEAEPTREDQEEMQRWRHAIRAQRIDLAIQLHGGGRYSNPLVLELGARVTAGMKTPDATPLDRWIPYVYYQHEVLRLLEVVGLVGASTPRIQPVLAVTSGDLSEARRLLAPLQAPARPVVVLHPGATDPRRRWPPEKFAGVADRLVDTGVHVVLIGDQAEAEVAAEVRQRMRRRALDLAGRTSLSALVGVLSSCSLAICNDSGPLHLALALGVRAVGIFWCGNMINAGPIGRARFRPAVSWRINCPECGVDCIRDECPHQSSFTADVEEQEVERLALELLADVRSDSPSGARAGHGELFAV